MAQAYACGLIGREMAYYDGGNGMSTPDLRTLPRLLEEKVGEARSKQRELEVALQGAQRRAKFWERLLEACNKEHSAEVVSILRDREGKEDSKLELLLGELYRRSEEEAKYTARRFDILFPEACKVAGIELDSGSRHPRYTVREFIRTIVDERKLEAQVTPRDGFPTTFPLDIDPLVAHLQAEIGRLFETRRDPRNFLAGLRRAYQAVLREEKKLLGDELPLRRVANRLSKNRARFHYDEFNVDLGNAVCSGETSIDGERLHLNHTRDARQGMLLYGLERSGYMGFISFKPEGGP